MYVYVTMMDRHERLAFATLRDRAENRRRSLASYDDKVQYITRREKQRRKWEGNASSDGAVGDRWAQKEMGINSLWLPPLASTFRVSGRGSSAGVI